MLYKIFSWLFGWIFESSTEDKNINNIPILGTAQSLSEDTQTMQVILTEQSFNPAKIKDYIPEENEKAFEFRPENFEQFIGQDLHKDRLKMEIEGIKKKLRTHIFFNALPGSGKTTMAKLIANELQAHFITRTGGQIRTDDDIYSIINEIIDSKEKYVVWFIDEIDMLPKKFFKMINPIIEQFEIAGKHIKPFVMIGATIDKATVRKLAPDTLDRFDVQITFDRYTSADIVKILKQYAQHLYKEYEIKADDINIIAENCKFAPRIGIAMLKQLIVTQNINKVLEHFKIVKAGLTIEDITILRVLQERYPKTYGASALSQKAGITEDDYKIIYEPYLCQIGYIDRVPMRKISNKGIEFLKTINGG